MVGRMKYKRPNEKSMVSLTAFAKNVKGVIKEKTKQIKSTARYVHSRQDEIVEKIGTKEEIERGNYEIRKTCNGSEETLKYVNGKLVSDVVKRLDCGLLLIESFRPDGSRETTAYYGGKNHDMLVSKFTYYEDGAPHISERYANGVLECKEVETRDGCQKTSTYYDRDGNILEVIKFKDRNIVTKSYYEFNGVESEKSVDYKYEYDDEGFKTASKCYDKGGNLRNEEIYAPCHRGQYTYYTAKETVYYQNGQEKSVTEWYENRQQRSMVYYDEQGNKTLEASYNPDGSVKDIRDYAGVLNKANDAKQR